ncbi:MAG: hypothetical protein ACRETF_05920 [Nevskiaceae bacterium]
MTPTRVLAIAALLTGVLAPAAALAKDEQHLFDIATVMASAEGRDRFDDTIKFYWSGQAAPAPIETLSIQTGERKTFLPMRTEREACDQSFIEALASLRDAARKAGANAIVEIKSLHKNREFRSPTEYECRLGYFAASVTLEGTLAKLPR